MAKAVIILLNQGYPEFSINETDGVDILISYQQENFGNLTYQLQDNDTFTQDEVTIVEASDGQKYFKLKDGLLPKNDSGDWQPTTVYVTLTNLYTKPI